VAVVLSAANAGTAGAVLASRRPRHPVGWLLLTFGLDQLLGRDSNLVVAAATLAVAVADQTMPPHPGVAVAAAPRPVRGCLRASAQSVGGLATHSA
jgi:CYTH domain-containing protein